MKIASVISYSSYHNPFIERVIEEAKKVSDTVIVVANSHYFNGEEDKDIKKELINVLIDNSGLEKTNSSRYQHNYSRREGYYYLTRFTNYDYNFVFFIDSDEVLEGDKVKLWLDEVVEKDQDYKLAHFWYYRDTCFRSRTPEEGAVLVSRKTLESPDMNWFGDRERENFSNHYNYMASYKNKVLGHHYSWAGTKEMLLRKVSSWGHNQDNYNWKEMVEQEFTHDFNGCPFRPNYIFDKIEPYVGFTFNQ